MRVRDVLAGIRTAVGVALLLAVVALLFVAWRGPVIEEGSVLVVDLQGSYVEAPEPSFVTQLVRLTREGSASMLGLVDELEKAGYDERLAGVVLRIRDLDIGWGKAQEIRGAVARMRESGRRTVAFLESESFASSLEYYVATSADEVVMPPAGRMPVLGLAAESYFLGGLWEKIGVDVLMERVGDWKSFGEQIAAEEMSEATREMVNWLLDSFEGQLVAGIQDSRDLAPDALSLVRAHPMADAGTLVKLGIVDRVASFSEVVESLGDGPLVEGDTYRGVDPETVGIEPEARVALVYGSGPVVLGDAVTTLTGGPVLASETVSQALLEASEDPDVRAIVFRVDSPGGSALASDVVWQAARDAAERRPLVVSFSDVAASGGYYVACGADAIVSHPGTLTGSIGVVTVESAIGGLLRKLDVGFASATRGEHADLMLVTRLPSAESRAVIEAGVQSVYERFVERVATGRSLPPERVDAVGRGRVWTGAQAAERGLVDALGGIDEAVARAKEAADIDPDVRVELVAYPRPPSLAGRLAEAFGVAVRAEVARSVGPAVAGSVGLRSPLPPSLLRAAELAAALPAGAPLLLPPVLVDIR